jgi:glycosyltransferase involved in cell wall biosynthesis
MTSPENKKTLSIIVPLYNEEANIDPFLEEFAHIEPRLSKYALELIFVNDGSSDGSRNHILRNQARDPRIRYIEFSRNFGKEAATTAGLHHASGDAALLIDADLQHPIELIPEFVAKWEEGSEVVIGVRKHSKSEGLVRKVGSYVFYRILNLISDAPVIPQATDFRLVDRVVIDEFNRLSENDRVTRGLIDWLGFSRAIITFDANEREHGVPTYRLSRLIHLALAGFVTSSTFPLRLTGYLGFIITVLSGTLGIIEALDRFVFFWGMNFTGTAILATITLFLVGIMLMSLGLLAFYLEHTYRNAQGRPLYVVRRSVSTVARHTPSK